MNAIEDQARSVFLSAMEQAPERWSSLLNEACGANAELRSRVEQLLRAHRAMGSIHGDSVPRNFGSDLKAPMTEGPGTVIGPYKLVEQIGEGGFGVVFLAEQTTPVRRTTALKILKPGMETRQVIARFEAERQALAIMDHPNIARVFDGGVTPTGRPYFVMELVKGVPITEFCDQNRLAMHERLKLFISVCQAVQHAHQKGIIHRDLKPSNVLVVLNDAKPVIKVIDFGVAKALGQELTETTVVTGFAQLIGTPMYMSPEQAGYSGLDIDTRSDIYSLGVLLYELLTGTTPFTKERFKSADYDEIRHIIGEEEPLKPSARFSTLNLAATTVAINRGTEPARLTRALRGDLDWIVMKALEKDRDRRYETANAFALDVGRYLTDEPVRAGPPSAAYRLRKFARRNRAAVLLTALVAASLLAVTINRFLASQAIRAERDRAIAAAQLEIQARHAEALQRRYAQAIADFVLEDFLALTSVDGQARFGSADAQLGQGTTLVQLLDRAAQKLDARTDLDPRVEAKLRWMIGVNYRGQGRYPEAEYHLERCVALRKQTLGLQHRDTLDAMNSLGVTYKSAGRYDNAVTLLQEVLSLKKANLGDDDPSTLATMSNLAGSLHSAGQIDRSVPLFLETLRRRNSKLGPAHPDSLASMGNLIQVYQATNQREQALALSIQTVQIQRAALGADHPETLASLNKLALAYKAAGQLDKALPLLEESLRLRKGKLGPDHPDTLTAMNNLASGYQDAGHLDKALRLFEEALQLRKDRLGTDHPDTLVSMNNLAMAYKAAGQQHKALPLLEKTLQLRTARLEPDHPDTLICMNNLAHTYQAVGQLAKALPLYEQTLQLRRKKLGDDHPDTLRSMNNLARTYETAGQLAKALPLYEQALQLRRKKLGDDHPETLVSMNNLALAHQINGRLDAALPLFEEAARGIRKRQYQHPNAGRIIGNSARALEEAKQFDHAESWRRKWLAHLKESVGIQSPDYLDALEALGRNLVLQQKSWTESESILRDCLARRQQLQPETWTSFATMSLLGGSLAGQGKFTEAESLLLNAYHGLKERAQALPKNRESILRESVERLVDLYDAWGKNHEAEAWRTKLESERSKSKSPKSAGGPMPNHQR